MTAVLDAPVEAPVEPEDTGAPAGLVCASALLATAAFAWTAGSVFEGLLARGVALLAAVLGVAVAYASTRAARPSPVQYGGAAAVLAVGALLAAASADGVALPSLVVEALRGGGLGQPPVAFDPGWRFLLFGLTGLTGLVSAGLALALGRPRTATLVVLPLVVGGVLLQPAETEVTATLVALLLLVGSLAVSFGADLAADGTGDGRFEVRRLGRGAVALAVLGGALYGTSQLGFLFPPAAEQQVVPPMRPPKAPPAPDRVLFTVTADRPTTWRLGTLDVYDGTAWLTPPFDASTLQPVDGPVPDVEGDTRGPLPGPGLTARIEVADLPGKALPSLANPLEVRGAPRAEYDPRTQALRTAGTRLPRGTTYEVVAAAPPDGAALSAVPPGAVPDALQPFLDVPAAPPEVAALLAEAPLEPFARLQTLRQAYFAQVVAAGAGDPVDVPPSRVVEMLAGREASPYEITAGEVLLARWAGVPARIGFGWNGGEQVAERTWEVRPKHGATWLEAWFPGSGWVTVVGTPPRAKASTSSDSRNEDPSVRPTDELALVVYVPVERSSVLQAYELARYWAVRVVPLVLAAGLLLLLVPVAHKALRRTARRRAALRLGPRARIAAAYAELRDSTTDLRLAPPGVTPLELLDRVEPDAEHRELAWLVTRSLWGDLQRDVRPEDVDAAETMARSVGRRLRSAQPALSRAAAAVSRASLRRPWTEELPTLRLPRPRRRTVALAAVVALLAAGSGTAVAVTGEQPPPPPPRALPDRVAPDRVGEVALQRERDAEGSFDDSLVADGRVFSLREGDVVQGSLQVAVLQAGLDVRRSRVRDQVLSAFAGGRFRAARVGEEQVFRLELPEAQLLLAFAEDGSGYSLLSTRAAYDDADRLFAALLASARGEREAALRPPGVPVPDPRLGSPT